MKTKKGTSRKVLIGIVGIAAMSDTKLTLSGEPGYLWLGPVQMVPKIGVEKLHDENFRNTGLLKESSWITRVKPSVTLMAQDKLDIYQLRYALASNTYHASREDNHTDHHLSLRTHNEFNDANRLDLKADFDKVESVTDTTNLIKNDKYNRYSFGGVYGLGSEAALFHLDLGLSQDRIRYDNRGVLNQDRERDVLNRSITGYYAVSPRSKLLLEVRRNDYDYLQPDSPLNSTSDLYLMGVTWEATDVTTGTIKVGYEKKDFDETRIENQSHNSWEATIAWQPRPYSVFTLTTQQGIAEGSVSENFIETTSADLNWTHKWTALFASEFTLEATDEDYSNEIGRTDDTVKFATKLSYEYRPWLTATVGYTHSDRDSNVPVRSYDDNVFMIGVEVSL